MAVISLKAAKLDRIAARINAAHANAEAASATVVQCAVEAGQLLLEVKETMAHGAFGPWLDNNVTFARQTARHYMRLAKAVDAMSESKRSHVSVLPLREALRVIAGGDNKHSGLDSSQRGMVYASTNYRPHSLSIGQYRFRPGLLCSGTKDRSR